MEIEPTGIISVIAAVAVTESKPKRKERGKNILRDKSLWRSGISNWSNSQFKKWMRVTRETFEFLLQKISGHLQKTPTNFDKEQIEPDHQLGLTLYRLGHGCSFTLIEDLFEVSLNYAGIKHVQKCNPNFHPRIIL